MDKTESLKFINEHRAAQGRSEFEELSEADMSVHLALINEHAPYGNDPWMCESKS